jgi:hypothetical protein
LIPGTVIACQHLFDLLTSNPVAFDADVPVILLRVVFQVPDESHTGHECLSVLVTQYKNVYRP